MSDFSIELGRLDQIAQNPVFGFLAKNKELPAKFAFKIALFIKEVQPILTSLGESKRDLVEKYADRDPETNNLLTEPETGNYYFKKRGAEFLKEFEGLMNQTVVLVNSPVVFSVDTFPDGILSAEEMLSLFPLVTFE